MKQWSSIRPAASFKVYGSDAINWAQLSFTSFCVPTATGNTGEKKRGVCFLCILNHVLHAKYNTKWYFDGVKYMPKNYVKQNQKNRIIHCQNNNAI